MISDAGTPTISDPGLILVKKCIDENLNIFPIPGPSAVTSAVSVSGFVDKYLFYGFLPKKKNEIKSIFNNLSKLDFTIVFFIPISKINFYLSDFKKYFGDRKIVIAKEMTKMHEKFIRGDVSQVNNLVNNFSDQELKGEFTVVLSSKNKQKNIMNEINDSIKIAENSLKLSSDNQYQWTIIDTAGRSQLDDEMMKELITIKNKVNPEECILVVDSMIGQTAVDIANSFNEKLGLTGLIITKLDGDSKGGSAVSIVKETGLPIKFIGTGEKVDEFDKFYPDRISSRILGMGDLQTLAEKASEQIDHQKAEDLTKKIVSDSFDFNDLLDQMNSIKKMGSLESIINMIPGVNLNQMGSKLSENESKMNKMKYMIDSMTPIERRNPNILNVSRRKRIATGSGLTHIEVNQLINQFNQTKKMMKSFYGKNGRNLNKLIKSGNFPN